MQRGRKRVLSLIIGAFFVVLLGVSSAWLISVKLMGRSNTTATNVPGVKATSKEAGKLDPNIKYDSAEGVLEQGGIDGEGTYHLTRNGGSSKNVYLTSSMVDLSVFVGKNVQIWGETLASKKAGWLMDVAKIQVK